MFRVSPLSRSWEYTQRMSTGRPERAGLRSLSMQQTSQFIPPPVLLLLSVLSVQLGAAIAKNLFPILGASGTVFVRLSFAAIILLVLARPRITGYARRDYLLLLLFGVTTAGMNTLFYASLNHLPLGVAVTIEFVGPLSVALIGSRRVTDFVWVTLATAGIILLAPIGTSSLDPLGVLLALGAGVGWAAYILLNERLGKAFSGSSGLALSMSCAAIVLIPFDITSVTPLLHNPLLLLLGAGVAVLSTVVPFSLELEALRRIPPRVFGILMSLEPAVAAFIGFVVLREAMSLRALIAMTLIILASGGVSFIHAGKE